MPVSPHIQTFLKIEYTTPLSDLKLRFDFKSFIVMVNKCPLSLPQVSSQHPYAEQYIGKPHVITINFNNSEEFDATIREIMRINVRYLFIFFIFSFLCLPFKLRNAHSTK